MTNQTAKPITLAEAQKRFPNRYTMEYVPAWAKTPTEAGFYYAPGYPSDQAWYDSTDFPTNKAEKFCMSHNPTWPMGHWLSFEPSIATIHGAANTGWQPIGPPCTTACYLCTLLRTQAVREEPEALEDTLARVEAREKEQKQAKALFMGLCDRILPVFGFDPRLLTVRTWYRTDLDDSEEEFLVLGVRYQGIDLDLYDRGIGDPTQDKWACWSLNVANMQNEFAYFAECLLKNGRFLLQKPVNYHLTSDGVLALGFNVQAWGDYPPLTSKERFAYPVSKEA